MEILRAMKEKHLAKQAVKRLLKTRLATKADNPDLSGRAL